MGALTISKEIWDTIADSQLKFISIDSVGGAVRISWEKFKHLSFQSYRLVQTSQALGVNKTLTVINDPLVNSYTDTEYMEGMKVTYELTLNDNWTARKDYFLLPQIPVVSYVDNCVVNVSWKAPMNINYLDFYYLHTSKTTVSLDQENKIYNHSTLNQRITLTFGLPSYFGLLYVPKSVTDAYTASLVERGRLSLTWEKKYHYGTIVSLCQIPRWYF